MVAETKKKKDSQENFRQINPIIVAYILSFLMKPSSFHTKEKSLEFLKLLFMVLFALLCNSQIRVIFMSFLILCHLISVKSTFCKEFMLMA